MIVIPSSSFSTLSRSLVSAPSSSYLTSSFQLSNLNSHLLTPSLSAHTPRPPLPRQRLPLSPNSFTSQTDPTLLKQTHPPFKSTLPKLLEKDPHQAMASKETPPKGVIGTAAQDAFSSADRRRVCSPFSPPLHPSHSHPSFHYSPLLLPTHRLPTPPLPIPSRPQKPSPIHLNPRSIHLPHPHPHPD